MKKIKLVHNGKIDRYALVDDDDFERIKDLRWRLGTDGVRRAHYVASTYKNVNGKVICILMHRLIMNAKPGQTIDHKDGDSLNNQKSNLRFCSVSENQWNHRGWINKKSSKYKGVFCKKNTFRRWFAAICYKRKQMYIGVYRTQEEAAVAYNEKAKELFGDFAKLNVLSLLERKGEK